VPESQSDNPLLKVALLDKIESRKAVIAIVGLGYVGLPLAVAIARAGHTVVGLDLDAGRVQAVNVGKSYIEDVSDQSLSDLIALGRLTAASDYAAVREADVAIIAVPTPIDEYRTPNLTYVASAAKSLAEVMKAGSLVVLESTTYPGTTDEVLAPAFIERGREPGVDLFVGYSPERIDPGNETYKIENTPKIVSGLDEDSLELALAFYSTFIDTLVPVSSVQTAEISKLFENIFRVVNIALVNEFQIICDRFGIDVWEVIAACSTKPYGFMSFQPGPGLGGHCVPVDPFYLAWKAREKRVNTEFIELAGRINANMPGYVVHRIISELNAIQRPLQGSRIGVLGVAYKKNSSDVRESPAVAVIESLLDAGAIVTYHDPHVASLKADGTVLQGHDLSAEWLNEQDCMVILTDHDEIDWFLVTSNADRIVDTRNALRRFASVTVPPIRTPATPAPA
jgi:UDP-N-acetyl-D-glucosamine dehydrogenase